MSYPDFSLEDSIEGAVCGVDEVGRGPLAGPVVAACVYIPPEYYGAASSLPFIADIRDSKKLSKPNLLKLSDQIRECFSYSVAVVEPDVIDEINILQASMRAMARAVAGLPCSIDHVLVDGNRIPADLSAPATAVVKGDSRSKSIAAASIVAKVYRDQIMADMHELHPHYGWGSNAGYPTKAHIAAIEAHGITGHHRKSFAPVRRYLEAQEAA